MAATKVLVLGTGCAKCNKLYAEVGEAIARTGVSAELEKIDKIQEIMRYGVAFVPALVIDGEVKSAGKVPSGAQIEAWLNAAAAGA